jgi:hypothetical protein
VRSAKKKSEGAHAKNKNRPGCGWRHDFDGHEHMRPSIPRRKKRVRHDGHCRTDGDANVNVAQHHRQVKQEKSENGNGSVKIKHDACGQQQLTEKYDGPTNTNKPGRRHVGADDHASLPGDHRSPMLNPFCEEVVGPLLKDDSVDDVVLVSRGVRWNWPDASVVGRAKPT